MQHNALDEEMWRPVGTRRHLGDRIVTQVKELIRSEQLKPGDRLPPERELASLLDVSRPVLREALRSLVASGQLSVRHGRGVFVERPLAEQDLRAAFAAEQVGLQELFAMRKLLECGAVTWAAQNVRDTEASADVAELEEALRRLDEAADQEAVDFTMLQQLDSAFHRKIIEMANNRFLGQTAHVLEEMMRASMQTTLLVPGRLASSKRDHYAVLEAIRDGEPDKARAAMEGHLQTAWEAAQKRLNEQAGARGNEQHLNLTD